MEEVKKYQFKISPEVILVSLLTVFSLIVRVINLDFPHGFMFDEIHRVVRAQKFLNHQVFITDQPHFGRYLIVFGILTFGDNPIGWRITQVISGTLLIPVLYLIGKKIFSHKYAGLLTAFFATFDLSLVAYSRIGVVIIYQVFFFALSILFFILGIENINRKSTVFFYLSAVITGLSISIKWTSLCLLPIFLFWRITKGDLNKFCVKSLVAGVLFLAIVLSSYTITFVGEKRNFEYYHQKYGMPYNNFIEGIVSWHKLAFDSHTREGMFHPYSSKWFTWPLMYRPVLLYQNIDVVNEKITRILAIGNPVIRWLSTLAVIFQLFLLLFKKEKIMIFLLSTYLISFLPYAFISRPMFLYHYLPSLLIQLLILEYTFVEIYKQKIILRSMLLLLVALIVFIFFYYYPFVSGLPVSFSEFKHRLWLKSWRE